MRKIPYYTVTHNSDDEEPTHGDSFNFHLSVVESKSSRSAELKKRVRSKDAEIEARFSEYDHAFGTNTLEKIIEDPTMQGMGEDLRSMYSYKAKPYVMLKDRLTKANGVLDDTCPNCDKDSVNSFDHLLPQSKYPEFSDHPLNLMPCCSECNSRKSGNWLERGKRRYLNLYLDDLPSKQFLFCCVRVSGDSLECDFSVSNPNGIEEDLFRKIANQFNDLDLRRRYKGKSHRQISDLVNSIGSFKRNGGEWTKEKIQEFFKSDVVGRKDKYGYNDWETLIYDACINTPEVFDFLYNNA